MQNNRAQGNRKELPMNLLSLARLLRSSFFTLVLATGGLSFTHAADKPSPTEQPPATGDVQERGVPLQGVIVQDNQLRAAPGFVLEKGANNQMMARQKAGGGDSLLLSCGCVQGTGNCVPSISNTGFMTPSGPTDVAVCAKSANGPCSGQCGWTVAPMKVGPPRER
jgi:hypothetical protein